MKRNMFAASSFLILFFALKLAHAQPTTPLPRPGVDVYFKASEVERLREKVARPPCASLYERLKRQADTGLKEWPNDKARLRIPELAPQLPDLTTEFTPKEFSPEGGKEAGAALERHAVDPAPAAAFHYLLTGERPYADYAWEVFEQCARVNRWGWFPWAGAQVPQIHFGYISRNLVFIADAVWDTLTPAQRRHARQVIAEKCVEPYYRLVLQTPGMCLYHLRSRNQGSNALAAAMIGSAFVGDAVPDNKIWFNSLLQTFHWAITSDIGWMGQNLEPDPGGYWEVSMQNLYTAAAVLHNVNGIDLRAHPGFEQATWYPVIHETTIPPMILQRDKSTRIDPNYKGHMGILSDKPLGLPDAAIGAAWWLDYAARFPDSPADYFVSKEMIGADTIRATDAHQRALGTILTLAWWDDQLFARPTAPTALAQFTDRMAGIRSGYGFGETYLYFNGDLFLSAKKELLCGTSGMAWHFPWHQYQITETGIETEGEPFAPSMIIRQAANTGAFSFFRAEAGFGNVAYFPQREQRASWTRYDRRERSVLYVRPTKETRDYFVFVDRVRHKESTPRWYAWTWHLWNRAADGSYGRFVPQGDAAIRAERPNAELWIQFLAPDKVAVEQHGIPSQRRVNYEMDHNARMMRAVAGGYEPVEAKTVVIPPAAWKGAGVVEADALYLEKPPTEQRRKGPDGKPTLIEAAPLITQTVSGIAGGARYRWSLKCKEENYRVYEQTAWEVGLELLDARGNVVAKPASDYGRPDPLKLGAPLSDTPTHDWTETAQYFDAPDNTVACRATFRAAGGAHYFQLGKLWLGPIELKPLGKPRRRREQLFVALVMPLNKGEAPPKVERSGQAGARVVCGEGAVDEIAVSPDGALTVVRTRNGKEAARFDSRASGGVENMLPKTNTEVSAQRLRDGLKPVLDEIVASRDAFAKQGMKNLALGAKVTASATRDERFPPSRINDNQTAEYPADGHLDYTLGITWSSGRFVGYGAGKESLLNERDCFPLYIKPTWWLLPEESLGHVELELAQPADVGRVRLLNTSNAGLNDFAAHTFRVELHDAAHQLLAAKDGAFGKVFDRPFRQAFFAPKWFDHYTPSYAGMLEPGLTVPFGDGWQEVTFDGVKSEKVPKSVKSVKSVKGVKSEKGVKGVKFVRVVITKYWGIGGGLNEIQVYEDNEK